MSGTRHTLQLVRGPLHVDITEAADDVRLEITGAVPLAFERRKLQRFLWPLVHQYETDSRPLSVSGRGADSVGHVTNVQGLGVLAWTTPMGESS